MKRRDDEGVRNAGTFIALFGVLLLAGALLFLMASVMPAVAAFPIVIFCFALLLFVQYAVIGQWLPTESDDDESEDRDRA